MNIKKYILSNQTLFSPILWIRQIEKELLRKAASSKSIKNGKNIGKPVIYYCGIPAHGNLGDLAQGVCIRRCLQKHYQEHHVTELETNVIAKAEEFINSEIKRYSHFTGGSPEIIDDTCGSVVGVDDIDVLVSEIHRICRDKPYKSVDCIQRSRRYNQNDRFMDYVKLFESVIRK